MKVVLSLDGPTGEFWREWTGPLLPVGSTVSPFVDVEWAIGYVVVAIDAVIADDLIIIVCELNASSRQWELNSDTITEMQDDLRQGGWLTYNEYEQLSLQKQAPDTGTCSEAG